MCQNAAGTAEMHRFDHGFRCNYFGCMGNLAIHYAENFGGFSMEKRRRNERFARLEAGTKKPPVAGTGG